MLSSVFLAESKRTAIIIVCLSLAGFLLYTAGFIRFSSHIQRPVPFALASVLILLIYPITTRTDIKGKLLRILNYALIFLTIGSVTYLVTNYRYLVANVGLETPTVIAVGIVGSIIALETCRRSIGWPLTAIVLLFLAYDYFGYLIPGTMGHSGLSVARIVRLTFLSAGDGIFGIAFGVMISVIFYFILLSGILNIIGANKFFIDLALALVGRFRSGPALSAVIASAFMGMINGSAPANVAATGMVTIPLMKNSGYSPRFAGAVEAVASSGGQIMPPIMGASAFIMAEFLGVPYLQVIIWAALPAFLYFLCCGVSVHLQSVRLDIKPVAPAERKSALVVLRQGWYYIIPIIVLLGLLLMDFSLSRVAFWTLIAAVIIGAFQREVREQPTILLRGLIDGVKQSLPIFAACAVVGMAIVSITMGGLGIKLAILISIVAGDNLLLALFLTMITALLLGMGLPTLAAYLLLAIVLGSTLVNLGIIAPAAHFFIFYFAIISAITPPVALAAYTAAGIAGAPPLGIATTAVRLAAIAFIIPFMFAYNPVLLLIGPAPEIILAAITALIGVIGLSMALSGFGLRELSFIERLIVGAGAILLITPSAICDVVGFPVLLLMFALQTRTASKILMKLKPK